MSFTKFVNREADDSPDNNIPRIPGYYNYNSCCCRSTDMANPYPPLQRLPRAAPLCCQCAEMEGEMGTRIGVRVSNRKRDQVEVTKEIVIRN